MEISEEFFERYRAIVLRKKGVDLDPARAREEFTALVHLVQTVHEHLKAHGWPDISGPIEGDG